MYVSVCVCRGGISVHEVAASLSVDADAFPPMVHTVGTCGPDTYRQIMVYADLGARGSIKV